MKPKYLLYDCESTGIERDCMILEHAMYVLDADLGCHFSHSRVFPHPNTPEKIKNYTKWVQHTHEANGLWAACDAELKNTVLLRGTWKQYHTECTVVEDGNLVHQLATYGIAPGQLVLAGFSVHFDRGVIDRYFPALSMYLHYRNRDLSSLYYELKDDCGVPLPAKPESSDMDHRASTDVEQTLKFWKNMRKVVVDQWARP